MKDDFSRRAKKGGIKDHKAALEQKNGWIEKTFGSEKTTRNEKATRNEKNTRSEKAPRNEKTIRNEKKGDKEPNYIDPDRKSRQRRALARQKRRRKRQIQRMALVAAMLVILLIPVMGVRAIVKGVSHRAEEKKTAEALELEESKPKIEESTAVITTAGDIIMHKPFLESSVYYNGQSYDYNPIFKYMKEIYEAADFSVVTTEYAMTDGNYSGYPTFCAPDAIAEALAANGIDMCLLANNHIYDNGDEGLQRTMDVLTQNSILYTGTRKNAEDKKYLIQDINGIKVGFLNYVYETEVVDDYKTINGIAVSKESENLINSFQEAEPQSLYNDVENILADMKEEGVEYTIAYMHWGVEYQTQENSYQDAIAQKLCDLGVDALIASHPHVIEPVDLLESSDGKHKMVCAYAIGNHLSNQRTEYMDGLTNGYSEDGMTVTLSIHRDTKGKITLEKADFTPTWVYHNQTVDNEYYILPLNDPDKLKADNELKYIAEDVDASLERTNGIVGEGVRKVQEALPLGL